MSNPLSKVFSVSRLKQSFRALLADADPSYKNYFRHLYQSYALHADHALKSLSEQLIDESYDTSTAIQILPVKKSGLRRNWTLLSIEDQIAYQAVALELKSKIYTKVSSRYKEKVFGHLLAPIESLWFFQKWNVGYKAYIESINNNIEKGKTWLGAFDIASCYDTINHNLLEHRLVEAKVDRKIIDLLKHWLLRWNNTKYMEGLNLNVGIPQGPMASKLLAELVLNKYEVEFGKSDLTYFRYIDDIVLLGKTEQEVRRGILKLDYISKSIGMIPAAEKIKIEEVSSFREVLESLDDYQDTPGFVVSREKVTFNYETLDELTRGHAVHNETRFKYVLNRSKPYTPSGILVVALLDKHLHLHPTISRYLEKFDGFPEPLSKQLFELLSNEKVCVYPDVIASILNACRGRVHDKYKSRFIERCKQHLDLLEVENQPLLLEALLGFLIEEKSITEKDFNKAYDSCSTWWTKTRIMRFAKKLQTDANSSVIKNSLSSECNDLAMIATDLFRQDDFEIMDKKEIDNLNKFARWELVDIEGDEESNTLFNRLVQQIGGIVAPIQWRNLIGDDGIYRELTKQSGELARQDSFHPKEWIKQLSICNELIIQNLFDDPRFSEFRLGKKMKTGHTHWNVGGIIPALANQFPEFHKACSRIQESRNRLVHPPTNLLEDDVEEEPEPNWDDVKEEYKDIIARGYLEMYKKCLPYI